MPALDPATDLATAAVALLRSERAPVPGVAEVLAHLTADLPTLRGVPGQPPADPCRAGAAGPPVSRGAERSRAIQARHRAHLAVDPDRYARGAWYTPEALVELLLDRTLGPALDAGRARRPQAPTVLDPSCGDGAFLTAALRRLVRHGTPPAVARHAVRGVDADPLAVLAARLSTWVAVDGPPAPLGEACAAVDFGDALGAAPSALGAPPWARGAPLVDVVVGNPPFVNPMAGGTSDADARRWLRQRFDGAVDGRTNPAAAFLALAVELARHDGGRIAMVQPSSTLAARHAAGVRGHVAARAALTDVWIDDGTAFDASVHTVAVVAELGASQGPVQTWSGLPATRIGHAPPPPGDTWGPVVATALGVPTVALDAADELGDLATIGADFRDEYYALAPLVRDAGPGATLDELTSDQLPVITVGLVDPAACWWGRRPARLHGSPRDAPVVSHPALDDDPVLRRVADRRLVPKVVVATQGRVLEAAVDVSGRWLPSVPLLSVVAAPDRLWHVAAAITSPVACAIAASRHLGTALHPGAIKVSASDLRRLPLPTDRDVWDVAAASLRSAQAAADADDLDTWRRGLDATAAAMVTAYGLGAADAAELLGWWRARLARTHRLAT